MIFYEYMICLHFIGLQDVFLTQCLADANDAVHLRAAFCDVWCNRIVRRRGLLRPLQRNYPDPLISINGKID